MKHKVVFIGGPHDGAEEMLDCDVEDYKTFDLVSEGADFVPASDRGHETIDTNQASGLHHIYMRTLLDEATNTVSYIYEGVEPGWNISQFDLKKSF